MLKIKLIVTTYATYADALYNGTEEDLIYELTDPNSFITFVVGDDEQENKKVKLHIRQIHIEALEIDSIKTQPKKDEFHMSKNGTVEQGGTEYEKKLKEELNGLQKTRQVANIVNSLFEMISDHLYELEITEDPDIVETIYRNIADLVVMMTNKYREESNESASALPDAICDIVDLLEAYDMSNEEEYLAIRNLLISDKDTIYEFMKKHGFIHSANREPVC